MDNAIDFVKFLESEEIDIFLSDEATDKTKIQEKKSVKPAIKIPLTKKTIQEEKIEIKTKTADLSNIKTLEQLKQAIADLNHPLKQTALNMVFSRGNSNKPKVMFIGEAPGQDEDIKGVPFVGKAGQLLDKMITAIKLTGDDFYISSLVNYRPENNRTPTEEEIETFLPFLKKHIELAKPEVICLLGAISLKALFPNSNGITKSRGEWLDFNGIPAIATFHPAYLLRFAAKKREAWEDLQKLQTKLN